VKVSIVYIYPANDGEKQTQYALRFINSYNANPPGMDHQSIIVLNGAKQNAEITCMFSSFPNVVFMEHDDSGWDIGAFQAAAKKFPCDLMVFFGGSSFFNGSGWLARMVAASIKHGNAQYGCMGNRGNLSVKVWPHIRTTAFWMNPSLFNSYPVKIRRHEQRHPFEHGKDCLTAWVASLGLKSWVVTWDTETEWANWDDHPEGFHRGSQKALLAMDHICEKPHYPRR